MPTLNRLSPTTHMGSAKARGCHTTLSEIAHGWKGVHWFIEGDISDCFGSLSHDVLMSLLSEHIHDNRFLRLIRHMLQAGYLEEWRWHKRLRGAPQGGVCSPILRNISLDKLDKFVETVLMPKYNRGKKRGRNPRYETIRNAIARAKRRGEREAVRKLRKRLRTQPSQDPQDPNFRRLRYVRYADDWVLGFSGPKAEAEEIKRSIRDFLCETLKLELSEEKTLITHARTGQQNFSAIRSSPNTPMTNWTDGDSDKSTRRLGCGCQKKSLNTNVRSPCNVANRHSAW